MSKRPSMVVGAAIHRQGRAAHEVRWVGPTGGSGWIIGPGSSIAQGYRGADPRYESLAGTYWGRRNDPDVIAWGTWRELLPWFVCYRGEANAYLPAHTAVNTCVEVLSTSCQVRRESNKQWVFTHAPALHQWVEAYAFSTIGGPSGTIQTPTPAKFLQDANSAAHGGRARALLPVDAGGVPDCDVFIATLTCRLGLIDTGVANDMALSNLHCAVGADMYPAPGISASTVSGASGWIPGCGYSFGERVTAVPRTYTLVTRKPAVSDADLLMYPPRPI